MPQQVVIIAATHEQVEGIDSGAYSLPAGVEVVGMQEDFFRYNTVWLKVRGDINLGDNQPRRTGEPYFRGGFEFEADDRTLKIAHGYPI